MEHCGDDFLAALAESMQDTEEWDDLQAIETEACGALADMLGKDARDNCDEDSDTYVHVIEDSPQQKRSAKTVMLDSSSDSEEMDISFASKEDVPSTSKIHPDRIHQGRTPQSGCHTSTPMVVLFWTNDLFYQLFCLFIRVATFLLMSSSFFLAANNVFCSTCLQLLLFSFWF